MESFWSTLKLELVYRQEPASRSQTRSQIFDYIEAFYNRQRAHGALNYFPPNFSVRFIEASLTDYNSCELADGSSLPTPSRIHRKRNLERNSIATAPAKIYVLPLGFGFAE